MRRARPAAIAVALTMWSVGLAGQTITQRGFVEGRAAVFPRETVNDSTRLAADLLAREEVFVQAIEWLQLAGGLDLRASSHDQVEDSWRLDFEDRGIRRPRLAVRRLSATFVNGPLTVDVGKQFIRWGRADILNSTDRFAPRDFLDVIDTQFLPVMAVHPVFQAGNERFELVWTPRMTPSRMPLFDARWFSIPSPIPPVIVDGGSLIPAGSQFGVRWNHTGESVEGSVSFFDGFNHLPALAARVLSGSVIELTRLYPELRAVGADVAIPTRWLTLKSEAELFMSPPEAFDEYVLYVVEVERQVGEWSVVAGYIGEIGGSADGIVSFAPDRGLARSMLGRVSYTVDPRRTVSVEGVLRQSADGMYVKGEYSQALGQNWRLTLSAVGFAGDEADFLGQYQLNSHAAATFRFSF